jgi:mannosyltransferase OCH1-like enzyme
MFHFKKVAPVDPAILERANRKLQNYQSFKERNKPMTLKSKYNSVIPLNLYVTWHTKWLPPLMEQNYRLLRSSNPEFKHYLYDETECRKFISANFDADVLEAFDKLIPSAYKADLWRYCVLFINGGVYIDIKFKCINNFKFIALTEKEHLVRDRPGYGICNGLMVCKPRNPLLSVLIKQIVSNTQTNFYGENALYPTGPCLFKQFVDQQTTDSLELYHDDLNEVFTFIVFGNVIILAHYPQYRQEQKLYQKTLTYTELWEKKEIYH